jgi:hypothetical protein
MVRALKKLQTHLFDRGLVGTELASYCIESLVYNVADGHFGHASYLDDMRAVLAEIFNATLPDGASNDWEHVHGLMYLFRGSDEWTTDDVHSLASAAWDELGLG